MSKRSTRPSLHLFSTAEGRSQAVQAGLQLLAEAHECADKFDMECWQFSVELSALRLMGVTCNDVRCLLAEGILQHALETTTNQSPCRTFDHVKHWQLHMHSCFLLTAKGLDVVCGLIETHAAGAMDQLLSVVGEATDLLDLKPCWLADVRELRLGSHLVKDRKLNNCPESKFWHGF